MATRYRVVRQTVRFCKQTYHVGELMPGSFSERDLYRVLYPSRLEKVEISDETPAEDKEAAATTPEPSAVKVSQGTVSAAKTPAAPTKTTGASLSGKSIKK